MIKIRDGRVVEGSLFDEKSIEYGLPHWTIRRRDGIYCIDECPRCNAEGRERKIQIPED